MNRKEIKLQAKKIVSANKLLFTKIFMLYILAYYLSAFASMLPVIFTSGFGAALLSKYTDPTIYLIHSILSTILVAPILLGFNSVAFNQIDGGNAGFHLISQWIRNKRLLLKTISLFISVFILTELCFIITNPVHLILLDLVVMIIDYYISFIYCSAANDPNKSIWYNLKQSITVINSNFFNFIGFGLSFVLWWIVPFIFEFIIINSIVHHLSSGTNLERLIVYFVGPPVMCFIGFYYFPYYTTAKAIYFREAINEKLYSDTYVPFHTRDLPELIDHSYTIFLGRVQKTLPAGLKISGNYKWTVTPVKIEVLQSLKGNHMPRDIFEVKQYGGAAEGAEFRPHTMDISIDGETYLFFIDSFSGGSILDSEHVINGMISEGFFFEGKTIEEAVSIISDCIRDGKIEFNISQIVSFRFVQCNDNSCLIYSVNKTVLKAQLSRDINNILPSGTEKWEIEKWDSFISDLEECGVLNWEDKNYGNSSYTGGAWWTVDFGCLGHIVSGGTDEYPDNWDSFMNIIDNYFGSLK